MLNAPPLKRNGFSLVELSIVLVILGLLVGGVLSGQNLIRASELRKYITLQNQYRTAISAFRDKYFALPGDMTNATAFWSAKAAANCTNNSGAAVVAATGTCVVMAMAAFRMCPTQTMRLTGCGSNYRGRGWWRGPMPIFVVRILKPTRRP
jgi:prepilin-type N-terminal cleavage/methylation domain-containing protein